MEQKQPYLKKVITVGEVLGFAITTLAIAISFYTNTTIRLTALEMRMQNSEKDYDQYKKGQQEFQNRIEAKLDVIKDDINKVKVEIVQQK
jgi:peptidoglycan hydrolase CwlO-like protein